MLKYWTGIAAAVDDDTVKACGGRSESRCHRLLAAEVVVASELARRPLNDSVVAVADYKLQQNAEWEILNDEGYDDDDDQTSSTKTKAFEEAALIEIDTWTDAIDYLRPLDEQAHLTTE